MKIILFIFIKGLLKIMIEYIKKGKVKMNSKKDMIMNLFEALKLEVPEGFFFSERFGLFQKVNKKIYVYVVPEMHTRWKVQAYERGTAAMCSLEARIHWEETGEVHNLSREELIMRYRNNIIKLFRLADKWLEKYGESMEEVEKDIYSPFCESGWQGKDITTRNLEV